jgi:glycosyltransferase involved in cell wall biosynthesis
VTTISEASRQELLQHVACDPAKITTVPIPLPEGFSPSPKAFTQEWPRILQVGTGHNKNLERVAQALEGLPCHLRIIGKLSEHQRQALAESGVDWSADHDVSDEQMVQEYIDCDILVFSSTYEGFGLPIVEAQATGRPVITSNLCSMPEVAGEAAVLVDPYDVAGIRAGVLRVIQEETLREELIHKGLCNVERFRPAAIAHQYAALYRDLTEKRLV